MKVLCDSNGFVTSFALIGELIDGIEVPEPEDIASFLECSAGFKVVNGALVKDEDRDANVRLEHTRTALREEREKICFPVINRGYLWYTTLTLTQWLELKRWYKAWLNVTETLTAPETPEWLDDINTDKIPDRPLGLL